MPLMEWSDKLSTGIGVFDADHKKLVGMVNNRYDAVQGGQGKETLGKILDGLIDYTKSHSGREEEYMTKHGYPDIVAHKNGIRI